MPSNLVRNITNRNSLWSCEFAFNFPLKNSRGKSYEQKPISFGCQFEVRKRVEINTRSGTGQASRYLAMRVVRGGKSRFCRGELQRFSHRITASPTFSHFLSEKNLLFDATDPRESIWDNGGITFGVDWAIISAANPVSGTKTLTALYKCTYSISIALGEIKTFRIYSNGTFEAYTDFQIKFFCQFYEKRSFPQKKNHAVFCAD